MGRRPETVVVLDEARATDLAAALTSREFAVRSVEEKPYTRRPAAPFMTSTLQQEASRKLRFSSQTTMRVAQRLYENGHITYMRTDSTTLSDIALRAARAQAAELYGAETVPAEPRRYERKVKNAQEAHEAIRPAGETFRTPRELERELSRDEHALYDLIWKRTIASQMKDASGQTMSIRLGATTAEGTDAEFAASGTVITFPGFLKAYEEGKDEPSDEDEERRLPALQVGQELQARSLEADGHATSPPARFTEATLVKALEDRGIGRPSTYAAIMGTILDRGYVFKKGTALVPTFLAFAVTKLLEQHFGRLVDYDFTARMEDDLDRIAAGDEGRVEWLRRFYTGDGTNGLHALVTDQLDEIDARAVNSIEIPGSDVVVRVGRYGPYVEKGDARVSVPDDLAPDELTIELLEELLSRPSGDRELGNHPRFRAGARRQGRSLRAVRHRDAPRGCRGQAAHLVVVQDHVARHDHARRGRRAPQAPSDARDRGRGGDRRRKRSLRPIREARHRDAITRDRGAAPARSPSSRRSRFLLSRRRAVVAVRPSRRSRSSAPTRTPAGR